MVDIDDDGDLDVITNDFNTRPQLLISDLSERNTAFRYLKIQLVGKTSNRDAIGSKVTIKSGERAWYQQHDGQSGYLSQSSGPFYFGLGDVSSIDQISVQWPSGEIQVLEGPIATNQLVEVEEAELLP